LTMIQSTFSKKAGGMRVKGANLMTTKGASGLARRARTILQAYALVRRQNGRTRFGHRGTRPLPSYLVHRVEVAFQLSQEVPHA
jgi:hypothetical protein